MCTVGGYKCFGTKSYGSLNFHAHLIQSLFHDVRPTLREHLIVFWRTASIGKADENDFFTRIGRMAQKIDYALNVAVSAGIQIFTDAAKSEASCYLGGTLRQAPPAGRAVTHIVGIAAVYGIRGWVLVDQTC